MSFSNLRYLRITGTTLDGTTPLTTNFSPNTEPTATGDRNQPYSWVLQTAVGRFSPARLQSRGSLGYLVIAKCWTTSPDGPVVLTSRTPNAAELAELKPPAGVPTSPPAGALDQPLESRNVVANSWSIPILVSPEHALTLLQPGDGAGAAGNTVELILVDVDNDGLQTYFNGIISGICCENDGPAAVVRTVTSTQDVEPFSGLQYILAIPTDPSIDLTLPAVGDVTEGTTLVVTRVGGGFVNIIPDTGETLNGVVNGTVVLSDIGQSTFVLRGGQWLSSDAPITAAVTANIVVQDSNVALPILTGTTLVNVTAAVRGTLTLPAASLVGNGVEYILRRTGDVANNPCRVQILVAAGDSLNGLTNGFAVLSNIGSTIRIRQAIAGWVEVSDRQSTPSQLITVGGSAALDSGAPVEKLIRSTGTGQTLTLPAAAVTTIGTTFKIAAIGGPLTIADGGSAIIIGGVLASTGSIAIAVQDTLSLTFDGTNWIGIQSATYVQSIPAPANVALTLGWTGTRIFRCTQAGAQIFQFPTPAACFIGMELQIVGTGAGGLTVDGNGASIISAGAIAATLVLAQNTPARLIYDGTTWQRT